MKGYYVRAAFTGEYYNGTNFWGKPGDTDDSRKPMSFVKLHTPESLVNAFSIVWKDISVEVVDADTLAVVASTPQG